MEQVAERHWDRIRDSKNPYNFRLKIVMFYCSVQISFLGITPGNGRNAQHGWAPTRCKVLPLGMRICHGNGR
jgi:hypothetical protein